MKVLLNLFLAALLNLPIGSLYSAAIPSVDLSIASLDVPAGNVGTIPLSPQLGQSSIDNILDAYQDGRLQHLNIPHQHVADLEHIAQIAVRNTLLQTHFNTTFRYGIFSTNIYQSENLPNVVLKTYFAPFGYRGKAWRGYHLAKQMLGGLFADTTIMDDVAVTIDGKPRKLRWALVQEEVKTKGIENWSNRALEVLKGMEQRGVRDRDIGNRANYHVPGYTLNLGETADGRFVHFDADRFVPIKNSNGTPQRVHDPLVLREAIRKAQRDHLLKNIPSPSIP